MSGARVVETRTSENEFGEGLALGSGRPFESRKLLEINTLGIRRKPSRMPQELLERHPFPLCVPIQATLLNRDAGQRRRHRFRI